ncbi:MAG: helix-turn-helix domain-containing protein [Ruminococcus sp.]|nr:helix-turn-helix domain-containing protein [Ruminococcus sp.]
MKIILNMTAFYDLMEKHSIETIRQLSRESGIDCSILYGAIDRRVVSKETYWKLAKFFGCHIEDLQIPDYSE